MTPQLEGKNSNLDLHEVLVVLDNRIETIFLILELSILGNERKKIIRR